MSQAPDISSASSAVPASDAERKTNPRDGGSPLEDVEDSSVDPDLKHTSTVAEQSDGDVDGCREDAKTKALEGLQTQAIVPTKPIAAEQVNLRQMVEPTPRIVRKGDEGVDGVELAMGLVSSESPDADRAWMGRHPRRRQGSPPRSPAPWESVRPPGHRRDESREAKRSGNVSTLPFIDYSPYTKRSHPSSLRSRSHDPSKSENLKLSAVSSQRAGPSQQHGTSPRLSSSPSLPPIKKKRAPTQPHMASTVEAPLSGQRNTATTQLTNLTVTCGKSRFRSGLVINHPFLDPLPRRKLEGSPERLLRSSKLSPRKAENIRTCFVRPQPINLNVVITRSLSPPFNLTQTREQNRLFLSMYTNARIY